MTKLYANIGITHSNDWDLLQQRVINAAQCNADAIVINKSTPHLMVPEEKKYIALESPWGTMPYIEVAKKAELSIDNAVRIAELTDQIGIPLIWSVTDSDAAEFVKEHCCAKTVKLHFDAITPYELTRYCTDNFEHVIFSHNHLTHARDLHKKRFQKFSVYYTTKQFPPKVEDMQLAHIDELVAEGMRVGYEGREAGIFPALAVAYKGVEFIEKYLGEADQENPSILTAEQFYDMFDSMNIMAQANAIPDQG